LPQDLLTKTQTQIIARQAKKKGQKSGLTILKNRVTGSIQMK